MTIVIDAVRAILLSSSPPNWTAVALLLVFSIALAGSGYVVFGRLQGRFVDYL
jgi:ABC-type polysaccharide/polyol phosphate export permease